MSDVAAIQELVQRQKALNQFLKLESSSKDISATKGTKKQTNYGCYCKVTKTGATFFFVFFRAN